MNEITINVYNDNDEIVKTSTATEATIRFGAVRQLMKLTKIDNIENTGEILEVITGAWDEYTKILSKFFPDMTEEDWDNVEIDELIPVTIRLVSEIFAGTLRIPKDPKN